MNGTIAVPKQLVEAILKYLWSRPMSEAYDLFTQLSTVVHEEAGQGAAQPSKPPASGQLLHRDQLMNQ